MKKIFLILLAALILRLINLNQSLWLDEAINVVNSQKINFWNFLTIYSLGDFHPPLYFAILWIWTHIFGTGEIVVRIPSVIFGVATVWLTYLLGKKIFTEKVALIAALILAFNPLHVYYSQEARMYSLAAFSAIFSFWALIRLLNKQSNGFILYALSVLLILYSDYLVYLSLPAQFIYVAWQERQKLGKFLASGIAGGVLWLPWLLILPKQLQTGQSAAEQIPGWAGVVGGANLKELGLLAVKSIIGRVSFTNKTLYAGTIAPILAVNGFIYYKALKPFSKETRLILLWVLVPVALAFLTSFYIPIFAYFRMIFILPGLALLFAKGLAKIKHQRIVLCFILLISSVFLAMYYLNPKYQREDWRGAVDFAINNGPATRLILFEDSNTPAPFEYYFNCTKRCLVTEPALKKFPAATDADLIDIEAFSVFGEKIYLFNYLVEISDPGRLVQKKLESLGYKNTQTKDFNGVGFVYEYSK